MKWYVIISILTFQFNSFSQEVKWGAPYKLRAFVLKDRVEQVSFRQHGFESIAYKKDTFQVVDHTNPYLGYSWESRNVKIEVKDFATNSFHLAKDIDVQVRDELNFDENFLGVHHLGDKPYLIIARKDREINDLEILLKPFSNGIAKDSSTYIHIGHIDRLTNQGDLIKVRFYYTTSLNRNFKAFYTFRHPHNKTHTVHELVLYDRSNDSWENFKWVSEDIQYLKLKRLEVDNKGNFAAFTSTHKNASGVVVSDYRVFHSTANGDVKSEILPIDLEISNNPRMAAALNDGRFYFSWVQQKITPFRRYNEKIMFQFLDQNGLSEVDSIVFDEQFIKEYWTDDALAKREKEIAKGKEFKDYYLGFSSPGLTINKDGDIFVIYAALGTADLKDPESKEDHLKGIKENFIVIKFNKDLQKEKMRSIFINDNDKGTHHGLEIFDHGPSYYFKTFYLDGYTYLLYNEEAGEDDKLTRTKLIKLDDELNFQTAYQLESLKEKDMIIRPEYCDIIGDTLYLYASNKLTQKHGYLIIK